MWGRPFEDFARNALATGSGYAPCWNAIDLSPRFKSEVMILKESPPPVPGKVFWNSMTLLSHTDRIRFKSRFTVRESKPGRTATMHSFAKLSPEMAKIRLDPRDITIRSIWSLIECCKLFGPLTIFFQALRQNSASIRRCTCRPSYNCISQLLTVPGPSARLCARTRSKRLVVVGIVSSSRLILYRQHNSL